MAELETAVRERAHVVALVLDNGRYGTIWRHQEERGAAAGLATRLGPVDFAAIAEACGVLGLSVGSDDEFEPALRQALEAGRPALLHLALDPRWTTPDGSPTDYRRSPVADEAAVEAVEALVAEVEAVEAVEAAVEAVEALESAIDAAEEAEATAEVSETVDAVEVVEAVEVTEAVQADEEPVIDPE